MVPETNDLSSNSFYFWKIYVMYGKGKKFFLLNF